MEENLNGNIFIVKGSNEEQEKYCDKVNEIWEDVNKLSYKVFDDNNTVDICGVEMTFKELMNKVFGDEETGEVTCSSEDALNYLCANEDVYNNLNYSAPDLRLAIEYIRYFGI